MKYNPEKELHKAVKKFGKIVRKATLDTNGRRAIENREKWQTGVPEENKCLSFRSKSIWHNGTYKNGAFYIVGDSTKTPYKANIWFYL